MSGSQQVREGFLGTLRRIICRLLCGDAPPPPPPPPAKEPLRSFEPGQVAIMAEYPPGLEMTPRQIVDRGSDSRDVGCARHDQQRDATGMSVELVV